MTRTPVLAFAIASAALACSAPARAQTCYQSANTRVYGDGNYVVNNNHCTIVQQNAPNYGDDTDYDLPTVVYPAPYYGPVGRPPYYMPMLRPMVRPFFFAGGFRR